MTKLILTAQTQSLKLKTDPIKLVLSMPVPVGVGEANLGANVGGCVGEVFRDKTGETFNFRTIEAGPGITVTVVGDCLRIETSGGDHVFREVPTGLKNGINRDFTTAFDFSSGTLRVYYNGYRATDGTGCDVEITGANSFKMAADWAPRSTENIIVDYIKD